MARWKGQVQDLEGYQSYQDDLGVDGEAIEFEWKISQELQHRLFLQQIQKDMQDRNIPPEKFEDRTIFMSMFNVIILKKDDQNCISYATKSQGLCKEIQTRTLNFPGSRIGIEMVRRLSRWTVGSHSQQDGTAIQRNRSSHLHKYQCFCGKRMGP